jgi:hypothetical protein
MSRHPVGAAVSSDQLALQTPSGAGPDPSWPPLPLTSQPPPSSWLGRGTSGVAVLALAAVLVTGCSSSGDGGDGGGGTAGNGLEDQSPAQVVEDAAAALEAAESVHVSGRGGAGGTPAEVDLRIQDGSGHGTITLEDARVEITRVDDVTYVKGDEDALVALGVQPDVPGLAANRWLQLGPRESSGLEGFSLDSFARQLRTNESPLEAEVEQTELDGDPVVVVSRKDGSRLYVANTGPAYPLRAESQGADPGRLDFSDYGADVKITAPPVFVELGELVWLDAITRLHTKIDEPFMASEINLTRAMMVALGSALGECSRELARIGSSTERLQPVHALVTQACAQYDEGAQCFDTAADVSDESGAVVVGTPEEQTQTGAIDCGFAAQGDGGNLLTQAEARGKEITSAPAAGHVEVTS